MPYKDITPPPGAKISITNGKLEVPSNPIVPFIRGDGTGRDIWAASQRVFVLALVINFYWLIVLENGHAGLMTIGRNY